MEFHTTFNSMIDKVHRQFFLFAVFLLLVIQVVQNKDIDCGIKDRNGPSGEIRSPAYPDLYPANAACKWHIHLEHNEIVTISFIAFDIEKDIAFDIEKDTNCQSDRLEISREDSKHGRILCGSTLPLPFISEKGDTIVTLRFTSDSFRQRRGFLLEYITGEQPTTRLCDKDAEFRCANGKCIPINWTCNFMDECGDKTDESIHVCPPDPTPPVPPITGGPIRPTSKHPPPSPDYPCEQHHFYCISAASLVPTCFPESQKCDGHNDCASGDDEENCEFVCSHFMRSNYGYFLSPNFPGHYDPNLNCIWTIEVSENNVIQLRFVVFDLEYGYSTDYVSVYDGKDQYTDKLGTYYASGLYPINPHGPPMVIESSGNQMMVTFKTDAKSNDKGFNATFQTKGDCIEGQQICSADDQNCFSLEEKCDGILTCMMGNDELGCGTCREDQIPCRIEESTDCYTTTQRCNGKNVCPNGEDEENCPVALCNPGKGLFLCDNKKCITESWICDGSSDCPDDSDEINCSMSTNVITAATVGSIICGLLLVAALSCTCKLYQLRIVERHPPIHISPLREIEDELLRREAPPSYTASMSSPHFDQAQRAFIEGIQAAVIARQETTTSSAERPNRRRNNLMQILSCETLQDTLSVEPIQTEMPNTGDNNTSQENECNTNERSALAQNDDRGNADGESTTESMQNTVTDNNTNTTASVRSDSAILLRSDSEIPTPVRSDSEIPLTIRPSNSAPSVEVNPAEATSGISPPSESNSCCTSDTDSDTNQEAFEIEQQEQNIIRAAANIRRMRIAGGLQNVIEGAQRNGGTSPPVDEQNENTNNSIHESEAETLDNDDALLDLEENAQPESTSQGHHVASESADQKADSNSSQSNETSSADHHLLAASNIQLSDDDIPLICTEPESGTNFTESKA